MNNQLKSVIAILFLIVIGISIGMLIFKKKDAIILDSAIYESAIRAISATINTDNDRFRSNHRSLNSEYDGFHQIRSKPILIGFDSIKSKRAVFNQLVTVLLETEKSKTPLPDLQQTKLFKDLTSVANQQDSVLMLQLESMVQNNYKIFKLRPKEIDSFIATTNSNYEEMVLEYDLAILALKDEVNVFKLQVLTAQMFRLQRLQFFEECFGRYIYVPCFFVKRYFPVLNPKKICLRAGEDFEAEIGIGSYHSSFNTSTVKLFVNGQQLSIDSDAGTAFFRSQTLVPGSVDLVLKSQVTNPWTGETQSGTSEFTYEIY